MKFKIAFYGILNKVTSISDFELQKESPRDAIKPENLHANALITKHFINLLELAFLNSGRNKSFIEDLKAIRYEK